MPSSSENSIVTITSPPSRASIFVWAPLRCCFDVGLEMRGVATRFNVYKILSGYRYRMHPHFEGEVNKSKLQSTNKAASAFWL